MEEASKLLDGINFDDQDKTMGLLMLKNGIIVTVRRAWDYTIINKLLLSLVYYMGALKFENKPLRTR